MRIARTLLLPAGDVLTHWCVKPGEVYGAGSSGALDCCTPISGCGWMTTTATWPSTPATGRPHHRPVTLEQADISRPTASGWVTRGDLGHITSVVDDQR
jgi:hypothetical protein